MLEFHRLLRHAADLFDDRATGLAQAAAGAHDFATGARWMHRALTHLRGRAMPPIRPGFQAAGMLKYTAAGTAAMIPIAAAILCGKMLLLALVVPCFYAVEMQLLFLFPLMLDHHPRPLRQSMLLTRHAGGTPYAMCNVLPIAALMLAGGFCGRGFRRSWCLGCLAICIWYEQTRSRLPHIREESFAGFHLDAPVKVLFASDLHLGLPWTRGTAGALLRAVRRVRPEIVLLGGDLLDASSALPLLKRLFRRLASRAPVYLATGNHDRRFPDLRDAARMAGVHWLEDGADTFSRGGRTLTVANDVRAPGADILCTHDPAVLCGAPMRLGFAGHLHGGQCVLLTVRGKLFPGYLFNRMTVLRIVSRQSMLLISRGLADTIPLRFNCPREVIVCTLS